MNDDLAQGASVHDTAERLAHAIHEGRRTMPEDRPAFRKLPIKITPEFLKNTDANLVFILNAYI